MTAIAHLSDLHFGAQRPMVREALLHALTVDPPDVVVISGDLTQNAAQREFAEGRAFLDRLRQPSLIVPGNHDIVGHRLIERFMRPYQRWRRFVTEGLEPEWADDIVAIRGVNSARPFGPYLNWSRGQFSLAQIAAMDRTGADRRSLVVASHHPVAWGDDAGRDYDLVTRGEAMLSRLARQPHSIMLLGHRHRSHTSLWNAAGGEREARGQMTSRPGDVLIVHAGTACSDRLRGEANSWNRLDVGGDGVSVETRTFDGAGWTRAARLTLAWGDR